MAPYTEAENVSSLGGACAISSLISSPSLLHQCFVWMILLSYGALTNCEAGSGRRPSLRPRQSWPACNYHSFCAIVMRAMAQGSQAIEVESNLSQGGPIGDGLMRGSTLKSLWRLGAGRGFPSLLRALAWMGVLTADRHTHLSAVVPRFFSHFCIERVLLLLRVDRIYMLIPSRTKRPFS